jgi:transglutaminase-like putative cysteine protease
MLRFLSLVVLAVLVGCSKEEPVSAPPVALARAAELCDKGDFQRASAVLSAALDGPKVSEADRKELLFQRDVLRRIRLDYPFTREGLYNALLGKVEGLSSQEYQQWIDQGRFDSRMIDGKLKFVGTSINNLFFRYPELEDRRINGKDEISEQKERMLVSLAIKKAAREQHTPYVLPHYFLNTMTLTVDQAALPRERPGELVRAWLPVPRLYPYQNHIKFIHSSTPVVKLAPETSHIRSAYFEQYNARNSDLKFSVTYSYARSGVYFDMDRSQIRDPDLPSDELKKFTSEGPHVVFTDKIKQLARQVAGDETNAMLESKSFFDWIGSNIKYSYAREYSTLTNISDYCLSNCYGDCGQEALLFITLCRSRGIPARWQSGWDLWPGFHDIHDWTEIYLAPYGWVPVDPWAGIFAMRYCPSLSPQQRRDLHDFYFGGLDYYRMAANAEHSQTLDPPKESLRSDDVDFQRGEVELGGRNIYFNNYSYNMDLEEFGCSPFTVDDFKDFPALAKKLDHPTGALEVVLRQNLPDADQLLLRDLNPARPDYHKIEEAVAADLNHFIEVGEPCLYEPDRFDAVPLRPETKKLLTMKPTGIDLSRLNRLLLEDAYPTELARTAD